MEPAELEKFVTMVADHCNRCAWQSIYQVHSYMPCRRLHTPQPKLRDMAVPAYVWHLGCVHVRRWNAFALEALR